MVSRADGNQKEIVDYLRQTGRSVVILSQVGGGCPDLLVGNRGHNLLIEVKSKNGKLRENQKEFFFTWTGLTPKVIRTVDEVREYLGDA